MNIYDFDETIYHPDSMMQFAKYCVRKYPHLLFTYYRKLKIDARRQKKGKITLLELDESLNSLIGYLKNPEKDINKFWEIHKNDILPWYLKQKRDDDIIISASPDYIIEPIAKILGVKCYASKVDRKTGKPIERSIYAIEKAKLFKSLNLTNVENFYSDSLSDSQIALMVKNSYMVINCGEKIIPWPKMTPELIKKIKEKYEYDIEL